MEKEQLHGLLYQALETEQGGIKVYSKALECAQNEDLKEEWQEYLEQTRNHERIVLETFEKLGLDPVVETPGRKVCRHIGQSLVKAMDMALAEGTPEEAELTATECVVLAETKVKGDEGKALREAHEEVEEEEDEHLYHTTGWTRELWIQALGMPAVLPPPEEEKEVKTAIGAARAKQSRKEML
jgi:hypothetical protein